MLGLLGGARKITGIEISFSTSHLCQCDLRWNFVREWPVLNTMVGWHLFHLGFICVYQVSESLPYDLCLRHYHCLSLCFVFVIDFFLRLPIE